jgi:hypothetical protein
LPIHHERKKLAEPTVSPPHVQGIAGRTMINVPAAIILIYISAKPADMLLFFHSRLGSVMERSGD